MRAHFCGIEILTQLYNVGCICELDDLFRYSFIENQVDLTPVTLEPHSQQLFVFYLFGIVITIESIEFVVFDAAE